MTDAKSIATEVASLDESVLTALPFISMILGFVPGAQMGVPIVAGVGALLKAVDVAAQAVAASDPNMSAGGIIDTVVNHLTPGQPNSPALSPETQDPSAQGSG